MSSLALIWIAALALIALALGWMSALIVLRLFRQRADARRGRDQAAVMRGFMQLLRGDEAGAAALGPYRRRARLMAESILELQGIVRGPDQRRVLDALREIGMVDVLAGRLARGSKAGRLASLEALAAIGGEEAQAAMRRAISSPEPVIRISSLKGLVQAGAPPSVDALLDHVIAGDVAPSGMFAELLREVVADQPEPALAALARTDLAPRLRVMLLEAIGRSGAYPALPALIAAAHDPDPEMRTAAVRGLGRLQHPAGAKAVGEALDDDSWTVRAAAAEAAGAAGFGQFAARLGRLLADEQWWVRFRAGTALRRLGPAGLDELAHLARDGRDVERRAAELALAEAG